MKVLFSTVHTILQNGREKWEGNQAWKKEKPCEKTGSVSRVESSFHACKTNMDPEQLENSACLSPPGNARLNLSISWGQKKKSPSGREKIQVSCSRRKPGQKTSPLGQRELFNLQAWTRPEFFKRGCSMLETAVGSPGESQSPFLKGQQGIQRVSETMHIPHTKHKLLAANPQLFQVYQKLIRKVVPGPFSFYWGCFINLKFLNILVSE